MSKLFKKNKSEESSETLEELSETIEVEEVVLEQPKVELNGSAYGVTKNSSGQWIVVRVNYDIDTQTVGELIILDAHTEKVFAVDRMKIEISKNLLY